MEQELKINISENLITDAIRVQMVKALAKKEEFLEAIVKSALTIKKNSYDRTTIFQEKLAEMIRAEAQQVFKEWLDTQRDKIRNAILKRLKIEKETFVEQIADKLIDGLKQGFYVSVSLKADVQERDKE